MLNDTKKETNFYSLKALFSRPLDYFQFSPLNPQVLHVSSKSQCPKKIKVGPKDNSEGKIY